MIGNSSSGIIEVPSMKIGVVNVGDRQRGRVKSKAVVDCKPSSDQIIKSVKKIFEKKASKKN